MKIVRFLSPFSDTPVIGLLVDSTVIDINRSFEHTTKSDVPLVKTVADLMALSTHQEELQEAIAFAREQDDTTRNLCFDVAEVTFVSPLDHVPKIIALAGNYRTHGPSEKPKRPLLFSKNTGIGIVDPNQDIVVPDTITNLDYEIELGVVIGKRGRFIPLEHAEEHIGGYTVFNDI